MGICGFCVSAKNYTARSYKKGLLPIKGPVLICFSLSSVQDKTAVFGSVGAAAIRLLL